MDTFIKLDDFSKLIGASVTSFTNISGGRNSRVYCLDTADGQTVVGKEYFAHPGDLRQRLQVEFGGLSFLWNNGVRAVPQPIAADHKNNIAVYEYVCGEKIVSDRISKDYIEQAVCFLERLKHLSKYPDSNALPDASAACCSLADIKKIIDFRLEGLSSFGCRDVMGRELKKFISNQFLPMYLKVSKWSRDYLSEKNIGQECPLLTGGLKVLSPSDFGFHNALAKKNGGVVFIDFEYFGWDSPVKMIADFILHPGMVLPMDLKKHFVKKMLKLFQETEQLITLLKAVYPMLGLVWCLIILNEFGANDQSRRQFTDRENGYDELCANQLQKAKRLLAKIEEEYEQFPYI